MSDGGGTASASMARDSATVAGWVLVSRVTGLGRVVVIAAVLGPTFLGNTFQAINLIPNLAYEFLVGALIVRMLVPALVRHVDDDDPDAAARVGGAFLGIVIAAFAAFGVVVVLAGPLLLRLLSLGVDDAAVAAEQRRAGLLLLVLVMPQLVLYGVAGTAGAAMNAVGRFGLAAGVPALENLGVIVAVLVAGTGDGEELGSVANSQLVVLGLGSTAAVALHAGVLWWGAYRSGVVLRPRAGWREPEMRRIRDLAAPSLGAAGLSAVRNFGLLVAANRVRGGVVAFQAAMNVFQLPVALAAHPVSIALLPRLSRRHQQDDAVGYRDELARGVRLAALVALPAAAACVALAWAVARALAYGEMANAAGIGLLAVSIASLGIGVIGECGYLVGTSAAYARDDARSPLLAMVSRVTIPLLGIVVAFLVPADRSVLIVIGLAVSLGNVVSAAQLGALLTRRLRPGTEPLWSPLRRMLAASVLAAGVAALVVGVSPSHGRLADIVALALAGAIGAVVYLAVLVAVDTPELRGLTARLPIRPRQPGGP